MAEKTRQELEDLAINSNLPDNIVGTIDPVDVRSQLSNERDSVLNKTDDGVSVKEIGGAKALKMDMPLSTFDLEDYDLTHKANVLDIINSTLGNNSSFGTAYLLNGSSSVSVCPLDQIDNVSQGISIENNGIKVDYGGKYFVIPHSPLVGVTQNVFLKLNGVTVFTYSDGGIEGNSRGVFVDVPENGIITLETNTPAEWSNENSTGSLESDINATRVHILPIQLKGVPIVEPTIVSFTEDATNTITQESGTNWAVSNSTNPPTGGVLLNNQYTNYHQEGNKRYYYVTFYIDLDSEITFSINGATDVMIPKATGYSLGSGDSANRAVSCKRVSQNIISIDRDNNNDVDMRVDLTFIAIF